MINWVKKATVAALAATATAVLGPAIAAGEQTQGTDSVVMAADDLGRATAFRQRFGLNTNEDYIRASLADPNLSRKYGFALAEAEVADLDHRVEVQEAVAKAFQAAKESPESAGVYYDQRNGGVPVFRTTSLRDDLDPATAALVPAGIQYRVSTRNTTSPLCAHFKPT